MTAHAYQYAPGNTAITRSSGCTWVTGATGVSCITGERYNPTPDKLHDLVRRTEEQNPATPGWHLDDLKLALQRYGGVGFEVHIGDGWDDVERAHDDRRFIVIQGDSDRFGNATCSGAFDGLHCVGVDGSKKKIEAGVEWWWLHDPICPTGRWERKYVIRQYAEKLLANIFFGWFTQRVPVSEGWTWTLRPTAGHETRRFNEFLVDDKGRITGKKPHRTRGASVACTPPKHYAAAPGKPAALAGEYVRVLVGDWKGLLLNAKYAKENA